MNYTDETDLVCVKLPADVCPTSSADSPRYLAIIFEHDAPPRAMGPGMDFLPKYEVIARACMERAPLTVDGSLRVKGKRIEPEAYIGHWRAALDAAIGIEQLHQRCGLHPLAEFFIVPTTEVMAQKARWINPPFETLGALLELHRPNVRELSEVLEVSEVSPGHQAHGTAPVNSLQIDLTARHGARDAWWLDDWLARTPDVCFLRLCTQRPDQLASIHQGAEPAQSKSPLAAIQRAGHQQGVTA